MADPKSSSEDGAGWGDALRSAEAHAQEKEVAAGQPAEAPQGGGGALKVGALVVLLAVMVWVWTAPPALGGSPEAVPSDPARDEAGLRFVLSSVAIQVDNYAEENGRLPAALGELGELPPEIEYEPGADGVYTLRGELDGVVIEWRSTDSLEALLPEDLSWPPRTGGATGGGTP